MTRVLLYQVKAPQKVQLANGENKNQHKKTLKTCYAQPLLSYDENTVAFLPKLIAPVDHEATRDKVQLGEGLQKPDHHP